MRYSTGECVDGRYEICALLGEGGMAEVYRALDTVTDACLCSNCPSRHRGRHDRLQPLPARDGHRGRPQSSRLAATPVEAQSAPYMVLEYIEGSPYGRI